MRSTHRLEDHPSRRRIWRLLLTLLAVGGLVAVLSGCDDEAARVTFCEDDPEACPSGFSCVEGVCVDDAEIDALVDVPGDAGDVSTDGVDDVSTDGLDQSGDLSDQSGDLADQSDQTDQTDVPPTCGNGVLDDGEECDTAIGLGLPGACPTAAECVPNDACDSATLTGSGCQAVCEITTETVCQNGDGCCPDGCDSTMDDDCTAECGNGVVEGPEETCDTAIADGDMGACPTACSTDMCSPETLENAGTCQAECVADPVACDDTTSDTCCPASCDATNDIDCTATCGNGVLEIGEDCDTGIAAGDAGACPTSCTVTDPCNPETLQDSGTCQARCEPVAISSCIDNATDGCCLSMCDATTDADCSAVCDNAVTEPGETCDPGAGDCPTLADCESMAGQCQIASVTGDPSTCDAQCSFSPVPDDACDATTSDGCCPNNCDSGNDVDCTASCGNGVLDSGEQCDTAIPSGDAGACPDSTTCTASNGCETAQIVGASCDAVCQITTTTTCSGMTSDMCCPSDSSGNLCTALEDTDCPAVCGNGVVEPGETCDTAIAAGDPGACEDASTCVTSGCNTATLSNEGTCQATCTRDTITTCDATTSDMCCPGGCNANDDADCTPVCGNSVVEGTELCEVNATDPTNECPTLTDCQSQATACQTASLTGSGSTCDAQCSFTNTTTCTNGDGCCPTDSSGNALCNANNDNDCSPVCGNGVVESGEQCDDGMMPPMSGDGCDDMCQFEPTAVRFSDLDLRDPHVFIVQFGSCSDFTNFFGFGVNGQIENAITGDSDGDGFFDLSIVNVFQPWMMPTTMATPMEAGTASCVDNGGNISCKPESSTSLESSTYTSFAMPMSPCLAPIADTLGNVNDGTYGTLPNVPGGVQCTRDQDCGMGVNCNTTIEACESGAGAACYVSAPTNLTFDLGGVPVPLTRAQVAGEVVSQSPLTIENGLVMGFLDEATADATMIDVGNGPQPLSSLFRGGTNNCECPASDANVADCSDMDTIQVDDGTGNMVDVDGWWFYLDFPADQVTWNPDPNATL